MGEETEPKSVVGEAPARRSSRVPEGSWVKGPTVMVEPLPRVRWPELAKGRMRKKMAQLRQALAGRFGPHHRFLISEHLSHIDFLDESIERLSREIAERLRPFEQELQLLDTIPGVNRQTAEELVAEVGLEMNRFPTGHHLASWAAMCPGHHESGGKRYSGKTRKGNRWLKLTLTEAAHGASHTKNTYLSSQFHRLVGRFTLQPGTAYYACAAASACCSESKVLMASFNRVSSKMCR